MKSPLLPPQTRLRLQRDRRQAAKRIAGRPVPSSLLDYPPKRGGILLVGMCTIAALAKQGHYFEGTYGRRVWKKLAAAGLHDPSPDADDDECWAAAGHGITDLVKRGVRSNDALRSVEIAEGVELLRKKVRKWEPRAVVFAFKNVAEAALGVRKLSPGPLPAFQGVPAFLLTGPYAKPEDAAAEAAQLAKI